VFSRTSKIRKTSEAITATLAMISAQLAVCLRFTGSPEYSMEHPYRYANKHDRFGSVAASQHLSTRVAASGQERTFTPGKRNPAEAGFQHDKVD
jgi:hypothetical protein